MKIYFIKHPIMQCILIKTKSLNVFETFKEKKSSYFPFTMHKEFLLKPMMFYIKISGKLWSLMKEEIIIIALLVVSL